MKIFIQNQNTSFYLTKDRTWTRNFEKAVLFPTIAKAVQFLHDKQVAGAAVVMSENVPVEDPTITKERE